MIVFYAVYLGKYVISSINYIYYFFSRAQLKFYSFSLNIS